MTDLLPIEGLPHANVDQATADLLRLIDTDPIHATDRRRIVEAVVVEARSNRGLVDPNRLRARLTSLVTGQLDVTPQCLGSTIHTLRLRGALTEHGWTVTTGSTSGNNGKPARVYRLTHHTGGTP